MSEILDTINGDKTKIAYNYDVVLAAATEYFNGDELAATVWTSKYALKDAHDNLYELTPDDMHHRLAGEFARIEAKYPNPMCEEEIFELLKDFKYIVPQGSPMSGIGNDLQKISIGNCFVIGNPEGMGDSYGGIFRIDERIAQLQKRRAGVGTDLSDIRPAGTPVNNAAITSTGIVPFMERHSNTTREVAQDGRRGALMLSCSIRHPEAEAFIDAKMDTTKVTGANISVKIHDDFMHAVLTESQYKQQWPINAINPKIERMIDAKSLWNKIIKNAWKMAEPGVLFWDKIISESPADCYAHLGFKTTSTNPCVSLETWVMTNAGPFKAKDLIGSQFVGIANGIENTSTDEGFFITGTKPIYRVTTKKGFIIESTDDHPYRKVTSIERELIESKMTKLKDIVIGDSILLGNNIGLSWTGKGNEELGWLLGSLLGDGTITETEAILQYWGDTKMQLHEIAVSYAKKNGKHRTDFGNVNEKGINFKERDTVRLKSKYLLNLSTEYGIKRDKVIDSNLIESTSSDFYIGFIAGWIDADGHVEFDQEKGSYIRISSTILQNLEIAQRMLARIGIISSIYKNRKPAGMYELPDGKGEYVSVECEAYHDLHISKSNILEFNKIIKLREPHKINIINSIIEHAKNNSGFYRERFVDKIESIEFIEEQVVCDCTVYPEHQFDANGLIVSNCGELPLPPGDSCRLLVVNLYSYVINPFRPNAVFNYKLFEEHVMKAQRLMDDIIDLELEKIDVIVDKIINDPEDTAIKANELAMWLEVREKCEQGRRTGTGITAEGDMLAALGLQYGTKKATAFAERIQKELALSAYKSSCYMARDRGAFSIYDASLETNNPFLRRLREADTELDELMSTYGRRNIALLTIAPAGSVSILTKTTSGIECAFMAAYKRRRKINPNDRNVTVAHVDQNGDSWEEYMVYHHHFKTWMLYNGIDPDKVVNMSTEELNAIIEQSPYYKAMANDVDWVEKVKMQGAMQKWIDHSISVTVNLPNNVTEELVNDVYVAAWKAGCKGCTIYRDGSRSGVLISADAPAEESIKKDNNAPKRPKFLNCDVIRFMNKGEKWIGFVGLLDDRPYEVFTGKADSMNVPHSCENGRVRKTKVDGEQFGEKCKISKYDFLYTDHTGSEVECEWLNTAFNEEYFNYAKLISGVLRHKMPLPYVISLITSLNIDDDVISTWKNGVARMIKKYIVDGTVASDKTCKSCGSDTVIYQEGCLICTSCASSKCS